jgi:hypothetical protein
MDDVTRLERRLADDALRVAGPSRPVDAAAVFAAIPTATQSHKWRFRSMFSATKFVVAGAIVALFGGFLLAGLLTQPSEERLPAAVTDSPSPAMIEALLSGMVTEEVEPGVYRVLSDGVGHDLVAEPPVGLTVGLDGSVWLLRGARLQENEATDIIRLADAAYRLGRAGIHPFEAGTGWLLPDLAVTTDGVAWTTVGPKMRSGGSLVSLGPPDWTPASWPDGSTTARELEATEDGAVWVTQRVSRGPGPRVARIADGEWTELPALEGPALSGDFGSEWAGPGYFEAAADGTAWLANGDLHSWDPADRTSSPNGLLHFDGEQWEVVDLPASGGHGQRVDHPGWRAGPIALGADGTLWVYLIEDARPSPPDWNNPSNGHLARLDADGWRLYSAENHGVPLLVIYKGTEAPMAADAAGRLWVAPEFGGVLSFDGDDWRRYLGGLYVNGLEVASDGSVLATALGGCLDPERAAERFTPDYEWTAAHPCWEPSELSADRAGLYVITPEAMAE